MGPEGWKLSSLGEACEGQLQTGPFGSQLHADEYVDSGTAVIMPKDLIDGTAHLPSAAKIPACRANSLAKHRLESGDLLFSRRGDVGRLALITACEAGSLCGTGCLRARPSPQNHSEFLAYFLQRHQTKRWLEQNAVGQTMLNMNTSILSELPLLLPPLHEQKKIAHILSTWDKAIETVEKLIENSKAQKKALMQQLLMGKRRFPRFTKTDRYFGTKYGSIPSDWNFPKLGDVAEEVHDRNGGKSDIPVLACSKHEGFVDSLKYFKKKVFSNDTSNYKIVVLGTFGFPSNHIEEGSIGYQNLYEFGLVSPIYTVFKTAPAVHDGYLYKLLKTEHYRQIFAAGTNASVDRRGSLRWREFSRIRIPLPPLEEQEAVSDAIDQTEKELTNYLSQLANLVEQKKALMQQLLTGKRRVKVDES